MSANPIAIPAGSDALAKREQREMLRPSARCIFMFAVGFPIALLPVLVSTSLWPVWVAFNGLALVAVFADGVLGVPASKARVSVDAEPIVYLGHTGEVTVKTRLPGAGRGTPVTVRADIDGWADYQDTHQLETSKNGRCQVAIEIEPTRRGDVACSGVWVRWSGPLGLVERSAFRVADARIAVAPNIHAVKEAANRWASSRSLIVGLKRQRYIGDGSEFESLKEFQPGYDIRAIDWKASARRRKLLVRQFEAERNHRVVMAFDTGYLMSQPIEGLPRLDHAINAGLFLALLSLKMGDRVGIFGFDREVRVYAAPQAGMTTIHRIMEQSSRLTYEPHETNFTRGLAELSARLRRRSIVVVLTDFADTVTAEQMVENLGQLSQRHLVIFVAVQDPRIGEIAVEKPDDFDGLNRAVTASELVREREVVMQRLRRHGVFCIDAAPKDITLQLLNRYLDVKQRGLI